MPAIYVGCCGFTVGRKRYYQLFNAVELQDTFYNPPNAERMKRLRSEAPPNFTFTMKAWQAITHPPSMRTWRRSRFKPPKNLWERYGFLRPTEENLRAWATIREAAEAIQSRAVIIQLPPSFRCTPENQSNMRDFLSSIGKPPFIIGIEVRGDWKEHLEELAKVIEPFERVIHVVDPLRYAEAITRGVRYYRLHGIGGREVNYRYRYSDEDLLKLRDLVLSAIEEGANEVYVMFNNMYMREDALRFKELLREHDVII